MEPMQVRGFKSDIYVILLKMHLISLVSHSLGCDRDTSISDVGPKLFRVLVLSDGSLTAILFRTLCGLPQELWSSLHWAVQVD